MEVRLVIEIGREDNTTITRLEHIEPVATARPYSPTAELADGDLAITADNLLLASAAMTRLLEASGKTMTDTLNQLAEVTRRAEEEH